MSFRKVRSRELRRGRVVKERWVLKIERVRENTKIREVKKRRERIKLKSARVQQKTTVQSEVSPWDKLDESLGMLH